MDLFEVKKAYVGKFILSTKWVLGDEYYNNRKLGVEAGCSNLK